MILLNELEQTQLEKDGFCKISNFQLDTEIINKVYDIIYKFQYGNNKEGKGFFLGMDCENKQLIREITTEIGHLLSPFLYKFINKSNYYPFVFNYIIKDNGVNNFVFPHQDWTMVDDDKKYPTYTCWIPLCDVGIANGNVGVIKGSHLIFDNISPSPSDSRNDNPLFEHYNNFIPYFSWIPMLAGEVLLFNSKIVHASTPNYSSKIRIAIGIWFIHKDSKPTHYYSSPIVRDKLLAYKINQDFYYKYDNKLLSKIYKENKYINDYPLVGELDYNPSFYTKEEIKKLMKNYGNRPDFLFKIKLKLLQIYSFIFINRFSKKMIIKSF